MSDMPTLEYPEQEPEEKEQPLLTGVEAAAYIPDVVDGALDLVADSTVEAAVEAGGTLLEGAAETVVDAIGSVLGSIFG